MRFSLWGLIRLGVGPSGTSDWIRSRLRETVSVPLDRLKKSAIIMGVFLSSGPAVPAPTRFLMRKPLLSLGQLFIHHFFFPAACEGQPLLTHSKGGFFFSAFTPCPRERVLGRGEKWGSVQELCQEVSRNALLLRSGQR